MDVLTILSIGVFVALVAFSPKSRAILKETLFHPFKDSNITEVNEKGKKRYITKR